MNNSSTFKLVMICTAHFRVVSKVYWVQLDPAERWLVNLHNKDKAATENAAVDHVTLT